MTDEHPTPTEQDAHELERAVAGLLTITDVTLGVPENRNAIRLRGYLQAPSEKVYPQIASRLRQLDYTAFLSHDDESHLDELLAVPGALPETEPLNLRVHGLLFVATILSALYAGAVQSAASPPDDFWWPLFHLWEGWPFALGLLSILLSHELGHYFVGRYYKVPVSLPYFIPLPISVFGTMGAIIRMKGQVTNRRVMLDLGAAGPLVGLVVALPVLFIGLSLSHIEPLPMDQVYSMEGNSLLYLLLKYAIFGRWLPSGGVDVFIHPVAFAGWAGLLVTSLNLIPAGQLDGGHVLYSLLGERAQWFTWPIIAALAALGLLASFVWLLWAGLIFLFGQGHPGPLDSITPLDGRRKLVAVLVLAVFVLTFTPIPLIQVNPPGVEGTVMSGLLVLAAAWIGRRRLAGRLSTRFRHG